MPNFFRISVDPTSIAPLAEDRLDQEMRTKLGGKLNVGDHVLGGNFNEDFQLGEIRCIGRVMELAPAVHCIWKAVELDLRPHSTGRRWWRTPAFRFADSVAERYMLSAICAEAFDGIEMPERPPRPERALRAGVVDPDRTAVGDDPGYVYVVRSPYGFKIGKARRWKERTQLFEVKLPFKITVEMTGWFSNYSVAERNFHRRFHSKRLEGEWFDLSDTDLAQIRAELQAPSADA